jgi:hypothetical protein
VAARVGLCVLCVGLASACGSEEEDAVGPPIPTAEELEEVARKIDEAKGYEIGPIGTMMWQFGNLGPQQGTAYLSDGSQASVYRKPRSKATLNDVEFQDIVLYFTDSGRLRFLEMVRRESTEADCEQARAQLVKDIGVPMPAGPHRFVWKGKQYRGEMTWDPDALGSPWCTVRFQAANDVQLL